MTAAEQALLQTVTREEWQQILAYARTRLYSGDLAVDTLMGMIQEVLARYLPEIDDVVHAAASRAERVWASSPPPIGSRGFGKSPPTARS